MAIGATETRQQRLLSRPVVLVVLRYLSVLALLAANVVIGKLDAEQMLA